MKRIDPSGLFVCVLVGIGLFVTGAAAQHEEHSQDAASSMPHMRMMADQKETAMLVDQLVASFASIEAEKDPEMLKQELTEHGKLLKQLQAKVQAHSQKMDMMHEKMSADAKN